MAKKMKHIERQQQKPIIAPDNDGDGVHEGGEHMIVAANFVGACSQYSRGSTTSSSLSSLWAQQLAWSDRQMDCYGSRMGVNANNLQ